MPLVYFPLKDGNLYTFSKGKIRHFVMMEANMDRVHSCLRR